MPLQVSERLGSCPKVSESCPKSSAICNISEIRRGLGEGSERVNFGFGNVNVLESSTGSKYDIWSAYCGLRRTGGMYGGSTNWENKSVASSYPEEFQHVQNGRKRSNNHVGIWESCRTRQ